MSRSRVHNSLIFDAQIVDAVEGSRIVELIAHQDALRLAFQYHTWVNLSDQILRQVLSVGLCFSGQNDNEHMDDLTMMLLHITLLLLLRGRSSKSLR